MAGEVRMGCHIAVCRLDEVFHLEIRVGDLLEQQVL